MLSGVVSFTENPRCRERGVDREARVLLILLGFSTGLRPLQRGFGAAPGNEARVGEVAVMRL